VWYERALSHGCSGGSNNLAMLYASGWGVPRDHHRAVQYWKLSASQENVLAMESLALYYLNNEKDPIQAREWHSRAIEHGNLNAKINDAEFEENCKRLEMETADMEKTLNEIEIREGAHSSHHNLKERTQIAKHSICPDLLDFSAKLQKILADNHAQGSSAQAIKLYKFDPIAL